MEKAARGPGHAAAALTAWRRLFPGRGGAFTSGLPVSTPADELVLALQPPFSVVVVVVGAVIVEPLGLTGWGLVGAVLVLLNGLFMLSRSLPDVWFSVRARMIIAAAAAPLAGALFAFDTTTAWAKVPAFVLAVHAGARFRARIAVAAASLCSLTALVLLAVQHGQPDVESWRAALLIVLVTPLGMLRRSNRTQLAAAHALVAQSRRAAHSEARAELARELHDVLAHSLSGVNMQLSMADALLEAGRTHEGRAVLQQAQAMVVSGLGEARRAVTVLRGDRFDVPAAIDSMTSGERESFEVVGEQRPMEPATGQVFIRVAQESLTNARRHAPDAAVRVTLDYRPRSTSLTVRNAPAPRDAPAGVEGTGMGLVGIRERAAAIGADVTAGPLSSGAWVGGWSVHLELAR